jgi:peptidoglycan hydrolase-like amidase
MIYYYNTLIKPWYFSSSDGKTLSYKEYCEKNTGKICEDIPYLHAVDDPGAV